jgi:hypothetical protein
VNLMANQFLDEVSLTEQSSGLAMNITDQEEVDPSEETTMLLWDPDLPMPPNDVFEFQEPPAEVLTMQTRSKGQLVSSDLITVQSSRGKQKTDHSKAPFVSQRNHINIHTWYSSKMEYNIVEYLK